MERMKIKDLLKETTYKGKLEEVEKEYNRGFQDGYYHAMEILEKNLKHDEKKLT